AAAQSVVTYQETAMLAGEVADGGTVPLPHYADGTEALESECTWTVGLAIVPPSQTTAGIKSMKCVTEGRVVHAYVCEGYTCNGQFDPIAATANYLIIAIRNSTPTPTPTQKASWGKVKASYR